MTEETVKKVLEINDSKIHCEKMIEIFEDEETEVKYFSNNINYVNANDEMRLALLEYYTNKLNMLKTELRRL